MKDKLDILKMIEAIGNRNFDSRGATEVLLRHMASSDAEIVLSVLRAAGSYPHEEHLFQHILKMAESHQDEEIRAMANGSLGAIIQEGLEFEEEYPSDEESSAPAVNREFYYRVKEFLLYKVDAPMESMEVRRRALEALGHLGFLPHMQKIILRFYHHAPNPYVKVSALYSMGLVKNALFEKLVLEELYSANDYILMEAIHSAANLELRASEKRLIQLCYADSVEVRCESVIALGNLGEERNCPEELREAIGFARSNLKQRMMMDRGEEIWDDDLVWTEIQEIIDRNESGEE